MIANAETRGFCNKHQLNNATHAFIYIVALYHFGNVDLQLTCFIQHFAQPIQANIG